MTKTIIKNLSYHQAIGVLLKHSPAMTICEYWAWVGFILRENN